MIKNAPAGDLLLKMLFESGASYEDAYDLILMFAEEIIMICEFSSYDTLFDVNNDA